ncbi:MAG TPA: thioredoxin [Euryarchaeota archaeon]|nr:thioredoxin [Euryarchaeota archaeon]
MKVDLYYTPQCPNCPAAKNIMRKLLKEFPNIEYRELNAFEHQDKAMELGFRMVPTIVIDGKIWHSGVPDEAKLREALSR